MMSLTGSELSAADVAAVVGNSGGGGSNGGNGGWGNDGAWWLIVLFLFAFSGNWGNNNGGGNNSGGGSGSGFYGYPYPYFGVGNEVQRGFDQASIMGGLTGIQTGVQGLSTQLCNCCSDIQGSLCNGFAGVNSAISNGFATAEIANNARQMADMQQNFALQSQFADCCCENRLASADLKYTIATENCADRAAISDGIRDIITSQNSGVQRILDQLCADKIDAKNEKIADLERQLTMANLAASQTAQTGRILADNAAQTLALEQYLNPVPIPAYVVQNPNCCPQNTCNCGCGCNSGCGCGSF